MVQTDSQNNTGGSSPVYYGIERGKQTGTHFRLSTVLENGLNLCPNVKLANTYVVMTIIIIHFMTLYVSNLTLGKQIKTVF